MVKKIRNSSNRKSLFVIISLFFAIIILSIIHNKIINSQKKYAHLINDSNRQRILSQNIALIAYELHTTNNQLKIDELKKDLSASRIEFLKIEELLAVSANDLRVESAGFFSLVDKAVRDPRLKATS